MRLIVAAALLFCVLPLATATTLFESNWSTALGSDISTALMDGGLWDFYTCWSGISEVMEIIEGSQVGWTHTPNVMQLTQRGETLCGSIENQNSIPESTDFYARTYIMMNESTWGWHDVTLNCCGSIQAALWSRGLHNSTHYIARVQGPDGSYPYNQWFTDPIPRNEWHRWEFHVEYVTANQTRIWTRVYDMDDNLLVNAHNIRNVDTWDTTLHERYNQGHLKSIGDTNLARRFGVSNPGQGGSADTGHHWYHAAVKVVSEPVDPENDVWVGPVGATSTVSLPGDLNGDGVVDMQDLLIIINGFRLTTGAPGFNPVADVNGDGVVNVFDLVLVAKNFGITNQTSVEPLLFDDFSHYENRTHLLNIAAPDNPWTAMNQFDAFVPGEFIFLDDNPPPGATSAKAMRYDHGYVQDCQDNVLDTGGGARRSISGQPTELWAEFRLYPDNWPDQACGFFAYKLFFFDAHPNGRSDLNWVGAGMQGSLGGGSQNVFTGGNSNKTSFVDFANTWTTVRWHTRLPSEPGVSEDGVFRLWLDGELVSNLTGLSSSLEYYSQVRLGANLNNMMLQDSRTFWDYAIIYDQDPGW
jgi:hypothetical protein